MAWGKHAVKDRPWQAGGETGTTGGTSREPHLAGEGVAAASSDPGGQRQVT